MEYFMARSSNSGSFGNTHRQNASLGIELQSGVIREKSHWAWTVISVLLIAGILAMLFFPAQLRQLVGA